MTREEAIKWVKFVHDVLYEDKDEDIRTALNMAIEALHREEAEEKGYCHRINYIPKPCENANCDCVEVVRCKDCRFWKNEHLCLVMSRYGSMETKAEHFCSWGERREP